MDRNEQFRRNNDLFELFMQQVLDDPGLLDRIPDGADIIFLPDSDPALREANLQLGAEREHDGTPVTYIRIEMVPQLRTIFVPRLNVVAAAA
jgi:hypothetical protein